MKRERTKTRKRKIEKNIILIIFCISIFISLLIGKTEAVNETSNHTTNTGTSQNTVTQQNTSNTTNQVVTTEKSSNANLSILGIRPYDFTGFKYGTTSYEVVVPEDTETVEVYAKAQDEKATVTGTGKKTLQKGENKAEVIITAEDGTTKTYTINIVRKMQQEDENDTNEITNQENGNGLAKLKIGNLNLSPEFKTNVYQYTVTYIGEDTKLNIEAKPTKEDYHVEVIGNENLQEGENVITILVSEANGENVTTYQIMVDKSLIDEEAVAKEEEEEKEKLQKTILGVVLTSIIIIAIIVAIMINRRRNRRYEEEFSGIIPYDIEEDNENYDDEYEEEIPKALKGKRFQEEEPEENEIKINKMETNELGEMEEEDFEQMPKDIVKEKFLSGYTSQMDIDFTDNNYKNNRKKAKHKGKRFK